mmetsp:Transcript_6011/g.25170  ORF Transcript_6011/g.25170 Transcript_6011/m.25170 type:complete len:291 (+) Transcript_6011:94-966(+)
MRSMWSSVRSSGGSMRTAPSAVTLEKVTEDSENLASVARTSRTASLATIDAMREFLVAKAAWSACQYARDLTVLDVASFQRSCDHMESVRNAGAEVDLGAWHTSQNDCRRNDQSQRGHMLKILEVLTNSRNSVMGTLDHCASSPIKSYSSCVVSFWMSSGNRGAMRNGRRAQTVVDAAPASARSAEMSVADSPVPTTRTCLPLYGAAFWKSCECSLGPVKPGASESSDFLEEFEPLATTSTSASYVVPASEPVATVSMTHVPSAVRLALFTEVPNLMCFFRLKWSVYSSR